MATAAAVVIEANPFKFKRNQQPRTIRLHPLPALRINLNSSNLRTCAPSWKDLKLQCVFSEFKKKKPDYLNTTASKSKTGESQLRPGNQLHVIANNLWESSLRALRKSAVGAVLLGLLLVMYNPKSNSALAASTGRVGGSWTTWSPYSRKGYNSSIIYMVNEHNEPYPALATAGSVFVFIVATIFLVITDSDFDSNVDSLLWLKLKLSGLAVVLGILTWASVQTNVVKLQVRLSNTGQALQTDLNRIADSVHGDTSSYKSLAYILNETVIALIQRQGNYISGYSSGTSLAGGRAAKIYLNYLSINERIHIHQRETLNVNDMKAQNSPSHSLANESQSDDIVVTILVAAKGRDHIPAINNSHSLEQALHILLAIGHSDRIRAVEVLWTPQSSLNAASISELPSSEVPL